MGRQGKGNAALLMYHYKYCQHLRPLADFNVFLCPCFWDVDNLKCLSSCESFYTVWLLQRWIHEPYIQLIQLVHNSTFVLLNNPNPRSWKPWLVRTLEVLKTFPFLFFGFYIGPFLAIIQVFRSKYEGSFKVELNSVLVPILIVWNQELFISFLS